MEVERINENTIRVSIRKEDLAARGIMMIDLLENQGQIEEFFHSILEEVDIEHQFKDTDSVTFQVLPNKNGLELYISKNGAAALDILKETALLNEEDLLKLLTKSDPETPPVTEQDLEEMFVASNCVGVIQFNQFEDVIQFAYEWPLKDDLLELYVMNDIYYLYFELMNITNRTEYLNALAIMSEFGQKVNISYRRLQEYGIKIMGPNTVEQIKALFPA